VVRETRWNLDLKTGSTTEVTTAGFRSILGQFRLGGLRRGGVQTR
jgi:hypothetical protein